MRFSKIAILVSIMFSVEALSDDHLIGVDYKSLDYESHGFEATLGVVSLNYEYSINEFFSTELSIGLGAKDVTIETELSDVEIEIEHMWGANLKAALPVGSSFSVYAKLGYGEVKGKATAKSNGVNNTDTVSDPMFGVGASYSINDKSSVYLDYSSYIDDSQIEISGLSIGYKFEI